MVKIDDSMVKTDDSKYFQKEDWGYKESKIKLVLIYVTFLHVIKIEENYINKKKSIILRALSDFQIKREVILKSFLIK